ncbi:uncharacterized protein LOC141704005 [Apium graveolens]|uniref:uncharacterized protein LOC141704005 n=1 Tax=Apium graveolens TaxID=4045 RepID=UPI003D7AECD7
MEELCVKLKFEGLLTVEPQGRSGGIALLWKDAEDVNLMSMSKNHIDVSIKVIGKDPWRLTGIYGEPIRAQRHKTWDLLRHLARDANLPWYLIGDFNNVTSQQDKRGGHSYPNWLVEGFNDCLRDAELQDLEITGHQFTWERGRNSDQWTEIRLDRVLANAAWLDRFPMVTVYNLEGSPSDHSPLLTIPAVKKVNKNNFKFKFENAC